MVAVDTAPFAAQGDGLPPGARVEVTDIRREAGMERTSLGVSLGRIRLEPPVTELVAAVVRSAAAGALSQVNAEQGPAILCGIRIFDVTTPSTPLYWDIDVKIEIVLRVGGKDRTVQASATDRTWLWPSEALIGRVVATALGDLADGSARTITALLAAP